MRYREVGPTRRSGRFVDIAIDPRDTDTFYAATASGGLWKTHDGVHWESIFQVDDVFSILLLGISFEHEGHTMAPLTFSHARQREN